jgi:hypothetical protein
MLDCGAAEMLEGCCMTANSNGDSRPERSELDRKIDREIRAAAARIVEKAGREPNPWKRRRLIRTARRFYTAGDPQDRGRS